ncbi:hypothetical protein Tco_1539614 [Tanacetum coccineum]
MIAPGSSRYSSNDMVHNHYLEEAKKKTQESSRNSEPSVMPSARSQSTANGSKPKPRINNQKSRNWPASKSSCVTTKTVPIAEHSRNSRSFSDSKHFVCSTCQKCVFNANHDSCVTKFLNEVNSRAKVPSNKTTKRYIPVEQTSFAKKPERQIPKRHRSSIKKTFVVHEKTMTHRSCLRWKPTGKIFKTVGLRWVPTGKIFTSSTTKVDSEPTNGSNDDITNQYECKQTLDVSAGNAKRESREWEADNAERQSLLGVDCERADQRDAVQRGCASSWNVRSQFIIVEQEVVCFESMIALDRDGSRSESVRQQGGICRNSQPEERQSSDGNLAQEKRPVDRTRSRRPVRGVRKGSLVLRLDCRLTELARAMCNMWEDRNHKLWGAGTHLLCVFGSRWVVMLAWTGRERVWGVTSAEHVGRLADVGGIWSTAVARSRCGGPTCELSPSNYRVEGDYGDYFTSTCSSGNSTLRAVECLGFTVYATSIHVSVRSRYSPRRLLCKSGEGSEKPSRAQYTSRGDRRVEYSSEILARLAPQCVSGRRVSTTALVWRTLVELSYGDWMDMDSRGFSRGGGSTGLVRLGGKLNEDGAIWREIVWEWVDKILVSGAGEAIVDRGGAVEAVAVVVECVGGEQHVSDHILGSLQNWVWRRRVDVLSTIRSLSHACVIIILMIDVASIRCAKLKQMSMRASAEGEEAIDMVYAS